MAHRLHRDEYTIGWVCAPPIEITAAQEMLDEEHLEPQSIHDDANVYTFGRIYQHNIVVAGVPSGQNGPASAAVVAALMKSSFPTIQFVLMVGIGGGVPSEKADIRLGDVVVSHPEKGHGGVIQYDCGKATPAGFEQTGFLNVPPPELLGAVAQLRALQDRGKKQLLPCLLKLSRLAQFARDRAGPDILFERDYNHQGGQDCTSCKHTAQVQRAERLDKAPVVHFGTIASANQVMRDGKTRDMISAAFKGVLCFEMEAAGLMNRFPCLVIRGICDYADSHKNKMWQPYAAGAAAAYARELISVIPVMSRPKQHTTSHDAHEQAPVYCLPFGRNHQFTGRDEELNRLHQKLFLEKNCQRLAIVGLGGIGKTQVALQFVSSAKQDHPDLSIFWVPALSSESFQQAYQEIARALNIHQLQKEDGEIKKLVQRHLSSAAASKWLIVVDNADDLSLLQGSEQAEGLLDFLPENENGLIIFTTRYYEVAQTVAGSDVVELSGMNSQDAISLLKKSLAQQSSLVEDQDASHLLVELDHLPLAITQAAAYINTKKISLSQYRSLLNSSEQDAMFLLSKGFGGNARYKGSENALAKTWSICFRQILKHDTVAANLLGFISCIEWKGIPYSLLPSVEPASRMADAIGTLCSYSFLKEQDNGTSFDMHRLVHLATRIWIRENGKQEETSQAAFEHVSRIFPSDAHINREKWRQYLPHVARIDRAENIQETAERNYLRLRVGRCLSLDGNVREAIRWLEKSRAWMDANLDESNDRRILAQCSVAKAYLTNGQIKEAVSLLEAIVEIEAKLYLPENLGRLGYQLELAVAYRVAGRDSEAVELLETVVTLGKGAPWEEGEYLTCQHELAISYRANGSPGKAIELLESIAALDFEELEQTHPNRLASQHELARAYHEVGRYREAIDLLEVLVAADAKMLAQQHPSRLESQRALARAYRDNGQVKEAIELLETVMAIEAKERPHDHPARLASKHALAVAYRMNSQVKEAIEAFEAVAALDAKMLAPDHPERLRTQRELAITYDADGQTDRAVELLELIVAVQAQTQAHDHPDRLKAEKALQDLSQ